MSDLPEPLVPADVDLRHFEFMKLDVRRLRDSDLALTASAEAFRAAVLLWCAAWHQTPAASLPNDDAVLARLALVDRKDWQKIRADALRGFVECSDGRLYHHVIAEKAFESWEKSATNRKAARTRWDAPGHANAKRTQSERSTSKRNANACANAMPIEKEREIERDPPPTPPATGGELVVAEGESSLEHRIMAAFMEKSVDKGLTWPPSEREHVTRLVERARAEPDPEAWIRRFLETAWRLKREGKGIWRDRPWMPRTFCGPKAITWVIEAMGEHDPVENEQELREFAATLADRRRRRGEA